MNPDIANALLQLGINSPLLVILVYLLKQSNEERREITDKFLATLSDTVRTNADASAKLAASLSELNAAIRERNHSATDEHRRIFDALARREAQP